jgi:sulfur transfer complex TusBCD TusB component (DsrH family)
MTLSSTVVASDEVLLSEVAGEAVLLNMDDGVYYGLNSVGAHVWRQLQQPASVAAVCESVLARFAAEAKRVEADVLALLNDLAGRGLVRELDAPPS